MARRHRMMACILLALGAPALQAQTPALPRHADSCQACHGVDGLGLAADIPHLAGQRRAYLVAQLMAFRDGRRRHELMNAVAAQLTPAEIDALATHWSARPPGGVAAVAPLPSRASMPAGYPDGFTIYQRTEAEDGSTVTLVSANDIALQAAREGRRLPDGSVIVSATHALLPTRDAEGRRQAGAALGFATMASAAGWGDGVPALLRNGNWHYGLFGADGSPRIGQAHARCLACHQPIADKSHVFTVDALKTRAAAAR